MKPAGSSYRSNDADAATEDGQPVVRPLTAAEREYLDQRVEETAAAIKKVKTVIAGAERTLKTVTREHADAVKARDAAGGDR